MVITEPVYKTFCRRWATQSWSFVRVEFQLKIAVAHEFDCWHSSYAPFQEAELTAIPETSLYSSYHIESNISKICHGHHLSFFMSLALV